ncbi:Multidrug resistance-associated protein 9 [Boothiomyces macroporosus]|uniref:Multidrug resistance-associated protein 9 n=1 Tax=Boothiomyces macroporosus TaxID=261099 RepID=A0AAD5UBX0_9FUNG|nr:Multidrug resistance-associated protein 9 [Boothiomyces macroporosus]
MSHPILQIANFALAISVTAFMEAKKALKAEDLYDLAKKDTAIEVAKSFDGYWAKLQAHFDSKGKTAMPSLLFTVMRAVIVPFIFCKIASTTLAVTQLFTPLALQQMIRFVNPLYDRSKLWSENGIVLAFILFGIQLAAVFAQTADNLLNRKVMQLSRSLLTDAIYKKSFRLSLKSKNTFTEGRILNMINDDIDTITNMFMPLDTIFTLPIIIFISIDFIGGVVGDTLFYVLYAAIPFVIILGNIQPLFARYYSRAQAALDVRIALLREVLYGIKIVKVKALEEYFWGKLSEARKNQLGHLFTSCIFMTILMVGGQMSIVVYNTIIFVGYGASGNVLTADNIFPTILFFQVFGIAVGNVTFTLQSISTGFAALKRVSEYLTAEENTLEYQTTASANNAIEVEGATWRWEVLPKEEKEKTEEELAAERAARKQAKKDKKAGLPVKEPEAKEDAPFKISSLHFTIPRNKLVAVVGTVGSGKSTLLNGLIGEALLVEGTCKIQGSISYCSQEPWILTGSIEKNIIFNNQFDQEKLDRVIAQCGMEEDLKLLPNGIHTEIGESGVNLSGGQKARLALARSLYSGADIHLLDNPLAALDSRVADHVFANAILKGLRSKTRLVVTHQLQYLNQFDYILVMDEGKLAEQGTFDQLISKKSLLKKMTDSYKYDEDKVYAKEVVAPIMTKKNDDKGIDFMVEEDKAEGHVKKGVYVTLLRALGGSWRVILMLLSFLAIVGLRISEQIWLTDWIAANTSNSASYIKVYVALAGGDIVALCVFFGVMGVSTLVVSSYMHDGSVKGVLNAPMSFHDTTPVGRIINRLSADVQFLDTQMMMSPLVSHISESLYGLSTVRAARAERFFIAKEQILLDDAQSAAYIYASLSFWLNWRASILSTLVTLGVSLLASQSQNLSLALAAQVGLALANSSELATNISNLLKVLGQAEAEMNAIERLDHYAHNLPQELSLVKPSDPQNWPPSGQIKMDGIWMSYPSRPDYPVIKNLSVSVRAGEKVGVVGRTGSGKSTLASAFFRLMELDSGNVAIDGLDISDIGLKTLRTSLQMITQTPVMFQGTIRSNLQLGTNYSDDQLWDALSKSGLKDYVSSLSDKLDSSVSFGGENFSLGQRQLICLARALLAKPRLLVMDEATASVDGETDKLIQQAIKKHLSKTTIISIAHRLNHIADFDKVMVMDQGVLVEFDTPYNLLRNPKTVFSQLVEATGPANAKVIRGIAFDNRH